MCNLYIPVNSLFAWYSSQWSSVLSFSVVLSRIPTLWNPFRVLETNRYFCHEAFIVCGCLKTCRWCVVVFCGGVHLSPQPPLTRSCHIPMKLPFPCQNSNWDELCKVLVQIHISSPHGIWKHNCSVPMPRITKLSFQKWERLSDWSTPNDDWPIGICTHWSCDTSSLQLRMRLKSYTRSSSFGDNRLIWKSCSFKVVLYYVTFYIQIYYPISSLKNSLFSEQ